MAQVVQNATIAAAQAAEGVVLESLQTPSTSLLASLGSFSTLITLLLAAIVYDQVSYIYQKGPIAGPPLKLPFIGPFFESVWPKFDEYVAKWNSGDLSCVSVFHKFVVIAASRDMARKVFNAPTYCKPCVVPIAHKLLRPTNWVFLDGQEHVAYRKGLNGLFTRQALDTYLPHQEAVYRTYFDKFLSTTKQHNGEPSAFMPLFRELMCAVSCRTFVGHYIADEAIKKIADEYYAVTAALDLVNFPIILPFTRPWYGKKAADLVLAEFAKCAAKAKVRMRAGGEPTCILDGWVKSMLDSERYMERKAKGLADDSEKPNMVIKMFTDYEISQTLFTFLFASQDATSSACTWVFQLMADNPDMLDKLREDALQAKDGDVDAPLNVAIMDKMKYTRAVVKETLRYRPPVLMVPYLVKQPFKITENYTAGKNTLIVPTTYPSLHDPEAYPNPDTFDPDRWITGNADQQHKNWLVFGTGPHYCLGQNYAQMNLMALIGLASLKLDWKHNITPLSEKIKVFATIFPQDDCLLSFTRRGTHDGQSIQQQGRMVDAAS